LPSFKDFDESSAHSCKNAQRMAQFSNSGALTKMFILVYCEGILKYDVYRPENYYFYLNFSSVKVKIYLKNLIFLKLFSKWQENFTFFRYQSRIERLIRIFQEADFLEYFRSFEELLGVLKLKHYLNGLIIVLKVELDFLS
jgi:hypothetical protein